jgi:hypothetical protein
LHGKGFHIPVEGGKPIIGFFTIRRIIAESPQDAERLAVEKLEQEDRYQQLVETTAKELGFRNSGSVRIDSIGHISWFRWHFSRHSPSFVFYSDEGV